MVACVLRIRTADRRSPQKKRKPKKEQNPKSEVFYVYLKFERHHLLLLADLDINY
jgi:hypothetical protein